MIQPTVGRVVWFYPTPNGAESGFARGSQPHAAIVAYVHGDRMVNLTVFDANGNAHSMTSVPLRQPKDERPGGMFCEWMPYQKGQAAKTEELEKQIAGDERL